MKYIMLVPDGMADLPMDDLDGQTPMQAARSPNFDALAEQSLVGSVLTVPPGAGRLKPPQWELRWIPAMWPTAARW